MVLQVLRYGILSLLKVCWAGPEDPQLIRYQAESPDEAALVAAGREFGFFFFRRTSTCVLVREAGFDAEFEILNILEFDSTRKRMSVICRTPEGKIMLYCKARACSVKGGSPACKMRLKRVIADMKDDVQQRGRKASMRGDPQ